MNIAPFIDHTNLKQTATTADIDRLCIEAVEFGFAAVCISPVYVPEAAQRLKGTNVKLATVVGFPFGYTYASVKEAETKLALGAGAQEIDMVINVAALKNSDWATLEAEVKPVAEQVQKHNALLKVIIESSVLSDKEIIDCCTFYKNFPVQFLKTSTGFAEGGASVKAVQLMRQHLPSTIQIKASGGIRDAQFAQQLITAGATRLGCSAGVAIVKEGLSTATGGY